MSKIQSPVLKASLQQMGFYDWVKNDTGSCVLEAVAGAGKTTTLINALSMMKGSKFFGAFNKKIVEEIAAKVTASGVANVNVATLHSAGLKALKNALRFVKTDFNKVRDIFRAAVLAVNPDDMYFEGPVVDLVGKARLAGVGLPGLNIDDYAEYDKLIDHYSIEVFDEKSGVDHRDHIIEIAIHVLKTSNRMSVNAKVIDFDDMLYMPLLLNCTFDKYDWVLIDEAQDTNIVRREIALRMMKPVTGRLVAVGDRHQAIYGFTGADANALDLIAEATNAKRLPLTTTFRCPKAVVNHAHQWVAHIQAADEAPEGLVRFTEINKLFEEVKVGDAILCRFNAPLIKNVYQLIAKGIPARVEGREIGAGLKKLANMWKVKDLDALLDKLDTYLEREVKKYTEKDNLKSAEAVTDKVECLRVIINRVIDKGTFTQPPQTALINEIDAIFGTVDADPKTVVLLSSIHKSKGREWKKVVWLDAGFSPFAKQAWEVEQEKNLCYVAATRSMHELVIIPVSRKGE